MIATFTQHLNVICSPIQAGTPPLQTLHFAPMQPAQAQCPPGDLHIHPALLAISSTFFYHVCCRQRPEAKIDLGYAFLFGCCIVAFDVSFA